MTTTGKKDTGDRVEMVVKVHCGTVLGDEFVAMLKIRPQNSPTMHLTTISTRSPAQPQSSELCCGLQYRSKVSHQSRLVSCATRIA